MKKIFSLFLACLVILSSFTLFGCEKNNKSNDTTILRICNCEDYIDESLLEDFTEETGIEVIYSTYGTNENLYNELVINPNSYDLVVPSEYMIQKLASEGRIQKLDFSRLLDYKPSPFIQERLEQLTFTVQDGENKGKTESLDQYMVGYMWGTMGWVYNVDEVNESDVISWHGPFENHDLSKKITIKDSVRDSYIVGLGMVYEEELLTAVNEENNAKISEILNRTSQEDIDKVGEMLSSLKPMLYGFEVDSGKNDIILGNINAYVAWSGDAAYAIDVAAGLVEDEDGTILEGDDIRNLSYYIPDEGGNIWFDGLVMPSASTNYDAVYKFLNFISRPDSVYRNMDYIGYTSVVADGEFELEDEDTGTIYTTTLFDEMVLGKFDVSESPEYLNATTQERDENYRYVDLSYFYGAPDGTYTLVVHKNSYGRLIAQYPTYDEVLRCAVMKNFSSETLLSINDMWESVKGETFPIWLIILIAGLVLLLALFVVLYRNKDKISWFKLPERKQTRLEEKGYKVVKKENI